MVLSIEAVCWQRQQLEGNRSVHCCIYWNISVHMNARYAGIGAVLLWGTVMALLADLLACLVPHHDRPEQTDDQKQLRQPDRPRCCVSETGLETADDGTAGFTERAKEGAIGGRIAKSWNGRTG